MASVEINIRLTPEQLAEEFAGMSSDKQAAFFNHISNMADAVAKGRQASGEKLSLLKRGDKSHLAKLTTAEVVEIRSMKLNGLKTKELSERFNISRDNIRRIIRRDTWRYI